jgi:hypothetical protein
MEIKARSRLLGAGPNVGALTALHRDEWSALFPMLNEYGLNTESVKAMTTAVSHLDVVFIGLAPVRNLPNALTSSLTPCDSPRVSRHAAVRAQPGRGRRRQRCGRLSTGALQRSQQQVKRSLRGIIIRESIMFGIIAASRSRCKQKGRQRTLPLTFARRCFDTCISLAVNETGGISVNWEHAWGDGHTMMHITQLLLQFARSVPPPNPSPMPYTSPSLSPHPHPPIFAQHLPFNLNPTLQAAITRSLAAGDVPHCSVTCSPSHSE